MAVAYLEQVNTWPAAAADVPVHVITIGDWRGAARTELSSITGRSLSLSLTAPSVMRFNVSGFSGDALTLAEGISDLWWVRHNTPIFRGRLVSATDNREAGTYTIECECVDYRGLLDGRAIISPDARHPDEGDMGRAYDLADKWALEDIAWSLIDDMQAQPGGSLGITRGIITPTKVTRDITFRDGDTILSCLETLSQADPGFEFNVDTERKFNLYYPRRGMDRGVHLDFGGLISKFTRTTDLRADYGNWTRTVGDLALGVEGKADRAVPDLSRRPEGRWDQIFAAANELQTQAALSAAAARNFATASDMEPNYDVTFTPGKWEGPSHVWVGDTVRFHARTGRLNVNTTLRVQTLTLDLDESNQETVTLTLGRPPANPVRYIAQSLRVLNGR